MTPDAVRRVDAAARPAAEASPDRVKAVLLARRRVEARRAEWAVKTVGLVVLVE